MNKKLHPLNTYRKLAGDTAIYGMSSIVGRILNWCLTPYYTFVFAPEVFGIMTNLYQYVAFMMVLLTYGMETSFFRFASRSEQPEKVYSTALISLFTSSFIFIFLFLFIREPVAQWLQYPEHPEYVWWLAIILGTDAITAIPFAMLRLQNRAMRFFYIKMTNILFNIGFNVFFLSVCPFLFEKNPDSLIRYIYNPETGVGYVFISNLLASVTTVVMLLPEMLKISFHFEFRQLKSMLNYGFPILIVGVAGMVSQGIDKVLIPFLLPESQNPMHQLGIYGANFKIAVLMNVFIQAFRYAFEPFFFSRGNKKDDPLVYATVMKYFVIFGLLIFLGMLLYLDVVKIIIQEQYHEGLKVVPVILLANLFFGIYFALSLWYKLTDKTRFGAWIALAGAMVTLLLNIFLIPLIGYMGSAIAMFFGFLIMVIISYVLGRKYYPVPYDLKRILIYFAVAFVLYGLSRIIFVSTPWIKFPLHSIYMLLFFYLVYMFEKRELKSLFKISNKK